MTFAEQLTQQGVQQGRYQGINEGIQRRDIEIAQKMLAMGTDLNFISEVTGLSKNMLEELMESDTVDSD